jgi:hypothetical protein
MRSSASGDYGRNRIARSVGRQGHFCAGKYTVQCRMGSPSLSSGATKGFACHTIVAAKDYVFTAYPKR